MLDYDILPSPNIMSKINFFINPYNKQLNLKKHMEFGKAIFTDREMDDLRSRFGKLVLYL
jgi:hypothetical protein